MGDSQRACSNALRSLTNAWTKNMYWFTHADLQQFHTTHLPGLLHTTWLHQCDWYTICLWLSNQTVIFHVAAFMNLCWLCNQLSHAVLAMKSNTFNSVILTANIKKKKIPLSSISCFPLLSIRMQQKTKINNKKVCDITPTVTNSINCQSSHCNVYICIHFFFVV